MGVLLTRNDYDIYLEILNQELILALGCTEPIAIAYAAARAREILNDIPDKIKILCSGNLIKNAKSVIVPNSGGMKGIKAAIALGIVAGDADKKLEVLSEVTNNDIIEARKFIDKNIIEIEMLTGVAGLYMIIKLEKNGKNSAVEIKDSHTNITGEMKDNIVLKENNLSINDDAKKVNFSVKKILDFANSVKISEIKDVIKKQIDYNSAIAKEGMKNNYGIGMGKTILEIGDDHVENRAKAKAAAGSDARMGGCNLPVVINSGSGNQGMTVSIPVIEYAIELKTDDETLYRALVLSNLISVYIKMGIGRLSAFCGVVSASCGCGAGITYLMGGTYEQISNTITNTLGNVSGIVCDGAKPSCACKIASSVDAAIMAHAMALKGVCLESGDGIIKENVDETIRNIGLIASEGMQKTDEKILEIMVGH